MKRSCGCTRRRSPPTSEVRREQRREDLPPADPARKGAAAREGAARHERRSGARGGLIAPDETTFDYVREREFAPKGEEWEKALAGWRTLCSDEDALFDKEYRFNAADIGPMITCPPRARTVSAAASTSGTRK